MRAGLLREIVTFVGLAEITSGSGFVKKVPSDLLTCKAYKRKANKLGTTVNAHEEFLGDTITLQVRSNPLINDSLQVRYNGQMYKIRMIDKDIRDNTLSITLEKLNQ